MHFAAGIAFALSAVLSGASAPAMTSATPQLMPAAQTVEEYVREYFADIPVMISIAKCESNFRHVGKDGNVLKNSMGSSAIGVFQIMSSIHAEDAKKLGFDIATIEGNAGYARHLYEKQSTKPWEADKASESCWGKTPEAKAHFALAK